MGWGGERVMVVWVSVNLCHPSAYASGQWTQTRKCLLKLREGKDYRYNFQNDFCYQIRYNEQCEFSDKIQQCERTLL